MVAHLVQDRLREADKWGQGAVEAAREGGVLGGRRAPPALAPHLARRCPGPGAEAEGCRPEPVFD